MQKRMADVEAQLAGSGPVEEFNPSESLVTGYLRDNPRKVLCADCLARELDLHPASAIEPILAAGRPLNALVGAARGPHGVFSSRAASMALPPRSHRAQPRHGAPGLFFWFLGPGENPALAQPAPRGHPPPACPRSQGAGRLGRRRGPGWASEGGATAPERAARLVARGLRIDVTRCYVLPPPAMSFSATCGGS